ncbi:hypothetical protein [Undibacterium curvum]|uniref:Uncharacterized protein n=1 Tax=Undibacterium curvum TaxID=2762294 RepID=A0ABR7A0P3_9BURK|nr:hypothetical protein [Undibacterium curvum]MBC3930467.1 hypothetical protein [Undibacterium curvum]
MENQSTKARQDKPARPTASVREHPEKTALEDIRRQLGWGLITAHRRDQQSGHDQR